MKRYIGLLLLASVILFSGCGLIRDAEMTTIAIGKKNQVQSIIIEAFDKKYYAEDELKEAIQTAIKSYDQKSGSKAVKLDKIKVKKGVAKVWLTYDSCQTYSAFNNTVLFSGTVGEALKAGYDFQTAFTDSAKKEATAKEITGRHQDAKVIISNEPLQVQTPKKILYVSKSVIIKNNRLAAVPPDQTQDPVNTQITNAEVAYVIYQQ